MTDGRAGVPVVCLGEVARIVSGGTPSRTNPAFWGGDIPWVKTSNIRNDHIGLADIDERITVEGLRGSSARMIPAGTILMAMYGQGGTRGRVSILDADAAISQNAAAFILDDQVDSGYMFQLLRHEYDRIRSLSNAGGLDFLSSGAVLSMRVPLPSLCRQREAARVLAMWDTAIDETQALVRMMRTRRDGLAYITLEREAGSWRRSRLCDLGTVSGSGVDKTSVSGESPVLLANFLDVMHHDFLTADNLTQWVTAPDSKAQSCCLRRGDVLFTPSSEIRGDIARSAVVVEDIPSGVYSYHVVRFRLDEEWDLRFRAYAFKTSDFYRQAYTLCEGSGQRYVLNLSTFRMMTVRVPDAQTQRSIGRVLATADSEIEVLERLTRLYRSQKAAIAASIFAKGAP